MLSLHTILRIAVTGGMLLPFVSRGQVVEIAGGTSSLYASQGASVAVHGRTYDLTSGIGWVDGHLLEGAHVVRATSFGQSLAGDFRLPFRLPTDIFDSSHYLLMRGFGARILHPSSETVAFAGVTSLDYSSPFFEGAQGDDPVGILMVAKTVHRNLDLFADTVLTRKFTQLAAVSWTPAAKLHLALTGGLGANNPYLAASVQVSRPRFDAEAAYFAEGSLFQRAFVPSPLLAEPDGGNVQVTVRPFPSVSLTVGHREFLIPQTDGSANTPSKVDEASAGMRVLGAQLNGTLFSSSYLQSSGDTIQNHAVSLTAIRSFTARYQVMTSYLASRPLGSAASNSLVANLSEAVNPRVTVTQNISYSNGTTNINFGGAFLSNLLEASAGYETFYIPAQSSKPLQQSLILDAKLTVFGRLVLHGASVVDPLGKMRYTADARTLLFRNEAGHLAPESVPMGNYVIRGRVLTAGGVPIDGAALQIDGAVLYTDSEGHFQLREGRMRVHSVKVLTSEFLNDGLWEVVSDPGTLSSVPDASQDGNTVIVLRHPSAT